jgi:hypothetical protein
MSSCPDSYAHDRPTSGQADQLPSAGPGANCPDCNPPVLAERPPLDLSGLRLARLCVLLFRPVVCPWRWFRQQKKEALVNAKLDQIARCRRPEELRQLLGEPLYVVSGQRCDGLLGDAIQQRPDLIECYESEGCCIDLWFKNDRLINTSGFVKPTVWDVALTGGGGDPQR